MDNFFEVPRSLAQIKDDLKELMAEGNDPYSVALFGITMRYVFTTNDRLDEGLITFIEERVSNIDELEESIFQDPESDLLDDYLQLLSIYYLISRDQRTFRKIVNWLPGLSAKQKQVILTWPEKMILSVFNLSSEDGSIYYQDVNDGQVYPMMFADSELDQKIAEFDYSLLAMLVPTDTLYLSAPPMLCQSDEELKKVFQNAKNKKDSELAALDWFGNTFSDIEIFPDELIEQEFYPAAREKNESTIDFAKRILKQDEELLHFEYYEQLEALLIKVIDTFPQMFFPKADVVPLLEGIKRLFTFESYEDEYINSFYLNDFWYLLIREHLPEEVDKIKDYRIRDAYWDADDVIF